MKKSLKGTVPALVVAAIGVALAWLYFQTRGYVPFAVLAALIFVGWGVSVVSRRLLLPDRPVAAVRGMEARIVVPYALAALASAIAIALAVAYEPAGSSEWPVETKKLVAATAAATSAFLTAGFIKGVESADEDWVAGYVKDAFFASYKRKKDGQQQDPKVRYFKPDSKGEMYVYADPYDGIEEWAHAARIARARGVQEALDEMRRLTA